MHRTKSGTQGRGLGVPAWTGTWTPGIGECWVGPTCELGISGHVFSGYPAGGIDSRIAGRSGTTCFMPSTIVRTEDERWKMENEI